MTIATTTSRVDAPGNGSATSFSFAPVVIFEASDLQVTVRDSSGVETVVTQGAGSANFSVSVPKYPGTGSITYPASGGTPIPSGSTIVIKRIVPLLQSVSLSNQGAYLPKIQEGEFDYLTAIDQQQQEQISRTIQMAETDIANPVIFPTSAQRAGKFLGFDGDGVPVAALPSGSGVPVSSVMIPVVSAASVDAAISALLATAAAVKSAGSLLGLSLNIMWFGAKPDGSDCTTAYNLAKAALGSTGGEIHFPAGVWTFSSQLSFTFPAGGYALTISGAGTQNTALYWPGNQGLVLNGSNARHCFHFKDITFRAGSANIGTAITLNQSSPGGNTQQNDLVRVTVDGTTNANCFGWAIKVFAWCNISYDAVLVYSNNSGGLQLQGVAATPFQYSVIHKLARCGFFGCATGLQYGSYVQGVSLIQCDFTNGTTGIEVPAGALGSLSQLTVTACQLGVTGSQINIAGPISEMQIYGNLLIPDAGTVAINLSGETHFCVFANNIIPATSNVGSVGILANNVSSGCSITGNVFQGLSIAGQLTAATSEWNVQSNTFTNCTATILNGGTGNTLGGGSL